ncbi:MAG: NAD(P)H-dependent flavin oxidoreductase [Dehalococcoidia bacterium]
MNVPDPLHTSLCDLLGIDHPIVAFTHDLAVVQAVALAGCLPVYGATRRTPEEIGADIERIREGIGARPFGVDLVLPSGMPERNDRAAIEAQIPREHVAFVEEIKRDYAIPSPQRAGARSRFVRSTEVARRQIEVVLDAAPPLLACGLGSPAEVVTEAKARGMRVASLVGSVKHARRAVAAGADLIVAQGYDAGAHTGEIGTFSLVPQVVTAAAPVPVLAAGGVVSGRHLAAALCLGAVGVWSGTLWLTAVESHVDPVIKAKLLTAGAEDTVRTRAVSGKPNRQIRTAWTQLWDDPGTPNPLPMPYHDILVGDTLTAIQDHRVEALWGSAAGQGIGLIAEERGVAETVQAMVAEAREALAAVTV